VLGTTLIIGMLVILLSVSGMGVVSGGLLLERYVHIMLFVAITGVIIFSIPFVQTLAIAVSGMALYLAFQLGAPDASVWKALSGFFFFAGGMTATVMARRTMNILAHKSFLLELRDRLLLAELERSNRRLERLSKIDGLTGAANRHFLGERLEELSRQGSTVAMLMCDIDDFKALNDHLGHLEGDRCLTQVARIIMECTRSEADCVARYGGEEFLVVLPHASEQEAVSVAERIRETVVAAAHPNPRSSVKPTVTLSIGLAVGKLRDDWRSSEPIQKRADTALYFAKRAGRNRVQLWHREIETQRQVGSAA
jgi:diguanylate cyclase (GGDEF)-like protein